MTKQMTSHFRFHEAVPSVVPWNARYPFPSQAAQITKVTPRLPAKSQGPHKPNQVIRFEFPAQGYLNVARTYLEFDLSLVDFPIVGQSNPVNAQYNMIQDAFIRLQNNVQSTFQRVRILYGSTVLEDINNYNVIVRALTEWTTSNQNEMNQTSITEGIGGTTFLQSKKEGATTTETFLVHTRQTYIQGISHSTTALNNPAQPGNGFGYVPNGNPFAKTAESVTLTPGKSTTRRYCVQLAAGLMNQEKLIPTKFMASQFAIEITLAPPESCLIWGTNALEEEDVSSTFSGTPSYEINNPHFIPEILEFDPSYDMAVVEGLRTGGVPIKFSSWHYYPFPSVGARTNLVIQENSRSIKSLFCVQRANNKGTVDCGALVSSSNTTPGLNHIINYQFRAGGRYFPASPVQLSVDNDGSATPQPAEAYLELAKALHTVGDYRLSTMCNPLTFGVTGRQVEILTGVFENSQTLDNMCNVIGYDKYGTPYVDKPYVGTAASTYQQFYAGNLPSANFTMATSFETSNGLEVSGMNGEAQNDISLMVNYGGNQDVANFGIEVYAHYDALIILKENNTLALIE